MESTGTRQVWGAPGATGGGVRVAVLDTGIAPGPDFAKFGTAQSRFVAFKDFVGDATFPYDDNGHGTHVAGIALGSGNRSAGAWTGQAPDADLVAVKVLDADGSGSISNVISGIEWCIQNKSALNIRVINLSLGCKPMESYKTDPLCGAARRAVKAGLVVVVAAGNHGKNAEGVLKYGGIHSPGIDPSVITVGASNTLGTANRSDDVVATYSSRGPTFMDQVAKPDVVAPGNRIYSVRAPGSQVDVSAADRRLDYDGNASNGVDYYEMSGTSMAAPQVAGIAALMLQTNPALQPNTVKGILQFTAQRLHLTDMAGLSLREGLST